MGHTKEGFGNGPEAVNQPQRNNLCDLKFCVNSRVELPRNRALLYRQFAQCGSLLIGTKGVSLPDLLKQFARNWLTAAGFRGTLLTPKQRTERAAHLLREHCNTSGNGLQTTYPTCPTCCFFRSAAAAKLWMPWTGERSPGRQACAGRLGSEMFSTA